MRFEDSLSLKDARTRFFAASGLGPDGGYSDRWVRVEAKPFPVYFPNTRGRLRAVRLHDLHHIATGYDVDWPGEIEIAAFEIAAGCRDYVWAWILNLGALALGPFIAPRRAFRAFVRGRRSRTLYDTGFDDSRLDTVSVGALREAMGLTAPTVRARTGDVLAFAGWWIVGTLCYVLPGAIAVGLALLIWRAI